MASGRNFVMREKDFGIEIRDKTGRVEYVERATFSIELVKHVNAGLDISVSPITVLLSVTSRT